jgi:predicted acetylornithine/succinylornithine family transaminase
MLPDDRFLVQNYGRQPVCFVRGAGARLWDDQGREYLDAFAGVAVSALGHAHPRLVEAIARQAATLVHSSNHYHIREQSALAATLARHAGFPARVLFCNTGTEANECAYKAVRLWANQVHGGSKPRLLAFTGSFHGRTMGAVSMTHTAKYREPFAPLLPCEFLPFGDAAAIEAAFDDRVAGVVVEPVQGESGVHPAPPGFLALLRRLCDRHHALLVLDEVQTGMARTGRPFAWQHDGAAPDVMTLAKGLGGGVPIGAAVLSEPVAELFKPGLHGTTFGGNPLACAAAQVVADTVLDPGFCAAVAAKGARLMAGLGRVFGAGRVRGRGLLVGVQLDQDPGTLVTAARAHGLVVGPAGGNTLRLAPPLTITEAELDQVVERLDQARAG